MSQQKKPIEDKPKIEATKEGEVARLLAGLNASSFEAITTGFAEEGHGFFAVAISPGSDAKEETELVASQAVFERARSTIEVASIAIVTNHSFATGKEASEMGASGSMVEITRLLE